MTWAKIDDKFPRHRRIRELRGDTDAKWLLVTAICFCSEHLSDGRIDDVDLPAIIHDSELSAAKAKRGINNLVKVGLWERNEDGSYLIRDFLDYNPSAEEVKELRKNRSEAGRVGGQRSGETRRANGVLSTEERKLRQAAVSRANTALKAGRIRVEPCSRCGSSDGLEMHHEDYNQPEEVVWLCRSCHTDHHKTLREANGSLAHEATASIVNEALASVRLEPQGLEPQSQSPAQSPKNKIKSSGLLDNGRSVACQDLLRLVKGGDNGTPRVVERFCKQLPRERIDRVASTLRVGVKPAIAVAALKREVMAYEAEVQAEGAA